MATSRGKYTYKDYTVAWICALPLELSAAELMLDEIHPSLPAKPNDDNSYILGRIHFHHVVIACLPSGVYGTTSATVVATQMRSSFESIRFFLMVGIGGGAPSKKDDIRLGDVVVSKPTRDFGGVVQYDFGKAMSGGRFQRVGVLNKPPPVLLSAISILQGAANSGPNSISSLIEVTMAKDRGMGMTFGHPGDGKDLLFDREYDHPESEDTCSNCDKRRLIERPRRTGHEPYIHYGLIASGNQVVKDSRIRDKIAGELGVLCFEMEAAGLMDNFPCLVVRGICDYSDSHKNKQWQNYAAIVAAAYTKELLSVVHESQVSDTPPVNLNVSCYALDSTYSKARHTELVLHNKSEIENLLRRISTYDHEKVHRKLSRKRLVGTTQWFLNHPDFIAWLKGEEPFALWCSGKIGSGKTMIATAVVETVKYRSSAAKSPTVFYYCDDEHRGELDSSFIISSFIKQIFEFLYKTSGHYPGEIWEDLRRFFGPRRVQPDFDDLQHVFTKLFFAVPETMYIIDGIDALSGDNIHRLLKLIRRLFCSPDPSKRSRILLSSRDQLPGYINMDTFINGIRQISTAQNVMSDIKLYIETSIFDKLMYKKLTDDDDLLEEIKVILLRESSDMFFWVYLQLEILWDTCHTDADIRSALATLPKDIEETYSRCVGRIDFRSKLPLRVLQWVSFSNRPLHIEELREAVAFDYTDTKWDANKKPQTQFIIGCCANLVVMDHVDNSVRFAHSSVKQYLEEGRKHFTTGRSVLGYPSAEDGDLRCGEYCVSYLSFSDFSLQIIKSSLDKTSIAVPSPLSIAKTVSGTGHRLSKLFRPHLWNRNSSVPLSFRTIHTPAGPNRNQYRFLGYAVENWALHTKQLPRKSYAWGKFEQLATCYNETWNFHPWMLSGRSKESQLHGLFGWAVKERHKSFLSIIQDAAPTLRLVCDLPLVGESLSALHIASKLGYSDIVEILLKFCDVNNLDQAGCTPLHYAAGGNHTGIIRLLSTQKRLKIDVKSKSQGTPLWLAANNGHEDSVILLVMMRAGLEVKDRVDGRTPLLSAVKNGHFFTARRLLEEGARIESRDSGNNTPLSLAIIDRNKEMIELLLYKGAKLETQHDNDQSLRQWAFENSCDRLLNLFIEKYTKDEREELALLAAKNGNEVALKLLLAREEQHDLQHLLLLAAENGHEEVVELLIRHGAIPDKPVGHSISLISAVKNGHEAVVALLLGKLPSYSIHELLSFADEHREERVMHVLLDNTKDYTPAALLTWAVREKLIIVMKLLLERGVDPNSNVEHGRTPLHWAAGLGYEAGVKLLLDKGADPNPKKPDSYCISLLLAACSDREAKERFLLIADAYPDAATYTGEDPLLLAAFNGNKPIVKLLFEKGAKLDYKRVDGQVSLYLAATGLYESMAELLFENGADHDFKAHITGHALLVAAGRGKTEMVQNLLKRGADLEFRDLNGQTPLSCATKNKHQEVITLLLENGARTDSQGIDNMPLQLEALEVGRQQL